MAKIKYIRWVNLLVFGLTLFLVFCLVFESFLELPPLVAWLGRWHPIILHFPIVLLLMAALLGLFGKKVPRLLLITATVFTIITAITGFFLGAQAAPKGDTLVWHQWMGAGLAFLAVIWFTLTEKLITSSLWIKGIQLSILLLVGFTGHYGGMVTHGEDFLALPSSKLERLPDNPIIYSHVVARILDKNCVSCHNPNKKKGEFLMTSLDALLKGGESGPALVQGKPEESEIIKRLRLPMADEEHMPPNEKKPLEEAEIKIIERWIALGASDTLRLNDLNDNEPLVGIINNKMQLAETNNWKKLPKVADSTLQNLASEYLTVNRISGGSNALSASLFMPPEYDPTLILKLKRVVSNIVELDLSGLPLGNEEMELVAQCANLERLEVDRTLISDTELAKLKSLSKLKHLKAYGTKITDESLPTLKGLKGLKTLYIWDTRLSGTGLGQLVLTMPSVKIEVGIDQEIKHSFLKTDTIK